MIFYDYIRANEEMVKVMVRNGAMSSKYLLWFHIYEFVDSQKIIGKRMCRRDTEIIRQAAESFRVSERTVFRACDFMRQPIQQPKIK